MDEPLKLIAHKMQMNKGIKKSIDKYSKQESIIIKVLDIINQQEGKELFEQKDMEIEDQYEEVKKAWEIKRQKYETYRRLKENFHDIDYFAENADF